MIIPTFLTILAMQVFLTFYSLFPTKTLSIGFIDNPKSFLPSETVSDGEKTVSNLIFRKLFKYREGELVNDLVDTWSMSEDQKEYTIKLKDDVYWQDGTKINSNDILYTLTLRKELRDQIDIEKISENEVKIKLSSPNAILPTLLDFGLEPSHLRKQNKLKPIGSTSYRVARLSKERDKLSSIILQSMKQNKPYPRVQFMFYSSDSNMKTGYEMGEITTFLTDTKFSRNSITEQGLNYIGRYFTLLFNIDTEKFGDPVIREKLMKSLNINSLKNFTYYQNALITQGPISYSPFTKDVFLTDKYDPETTLTAAEKTILGDIKVLLPNNQDGRQIEIFLKEYWEKKLGVKLIFEYEELGTLIQKGRGGEYEVMFLGHEVKPDPDRYVFWHSTQIENGFNFSQFSDLRADKSLEEGRLATKFEDRHPHYNIFQDVMDTKVPAVFLYHPGQYFYTNKIYPVSLPKVIYYPSDIVNNL